MRFVEANNRVACVYIRTGAAIKLDAATCYVITIISLKKIIRLTRIKTMMRIKSSYVIEFIINYFAVSASQYPEGRSI